MDETLCSFEIGGINSIVISAERKGQWRAFDKVLSFLNSIDTQGVTGKELRSFIYHSVMDMRPSNAE